MKLTPQWISGFVDGDGCFDVQQLKERKRFRFICSQDKRSTDLLYAMKTHFRCGTVHKAGGNMMEYSMSNPKHLRDNCISFFEKYPLETNKKHSFYKFATALQEYMEERGEDAGPAVHPPKKTGELSAGWFRGFVDAEGCFSVHSVGLSFQPCFLLGAHEDKELMDRCRDLIKCGSRCQRKDGMEMLQVSSLGDLEEKLIPFFETRGSAVLLRTYKRIAFQKFRKIVRFMVSGRHNDEGVRVQIEKLRFSMNQIQASGEKVPENMLRSQ